MIEPVNVLSVDQLKAVAAQMKAAAGEDDKGDEYTKGKEETVGEFVEGMSEQERERHRTYGGNKAVIMYGRCFSLCLTKDDHHGHQWHMSMIEVTGHQRFRPVDEQNQQVILGAFFSVWKAVPNPGEWKEVLHFVGND